MMNKRTFIRVLGIVLVLVAILGIATPAAAKLKAVADFSVWDDNDFQFKHSIVNLWLDGSETHVIHELGFDKKAYDPNDGGTTQEVCDRIHALGLAGDPSWLEDCPTSIATTGDGNYAGVLELGIPYDDIDGARAFNSSLDWGIIDCDLNGDMSLDGSDLLYNTLINFNPGGAIGHIPYLANWDIFNTPPTPHVQSDFFKVLAIDTKTVCSNNTCKHELVTTIFLDLDINGDNQLTHAGDGVPADASGALPGGCTCFFARIFPITWPTTPATPAWNGNPQARFSAGGGDKTVNFNLYGPTAITLDSLAAQSPGGVHPFAWAGIFVLVTVIAVDLIRSSRRRQQT
jgi:hypothetical protein